MQIGGISSIPTINTIAPAQRSSATTAASTASAAQKPAAAATTSPSTTSAAPSSQATHAASQSHGGGGAQGATAAAATDSLSATYSTTVGGKSYSGSVSEANGEYTASVPNLPGATATGSSAQAAENNLSAIIDRLV